MAEAMRGLKVKPTYENLVGVTFSDGLEHFQFPNRDAEPLRDGFILSQLDGEGMRQMQLQQELAIKETFQEHLSKQASDTTGVNISDIRQSSNAEAQTHRINNMLRPTGFRDVSVQQGTKPSRPTQFTDKSSETRYQDTAFFNFSDEMDTTAAPTGTDIGEQVARARSLADYDKHIEIRTRQVVEGVRQEAVSSLLQQEQRFTQQRAQDQVQPAAHIQPIEHQAQNVINEAHGAKYEVQGARQK